MDLEKWKRIEDYSNYEVSSFGNFRRIDGKSVCKWKTNWGYMQTQFNTKKKQNCHRLVASAFIPNPNNYPIINHINGIKTDNRIENLEWCTQSQNARHAFKLGLSCIDGERHPSAKLTDEDVINIRRARSAGLTHTLIASYYDMSITAIQSICNGRNWKHI